MEFCINLAIYVFSMSTFGPGIAVSRFDKNKRLETVKAGDLIIKDIFCLIHLYK